MSPAAFLLAGFLVFCRVGGCFMIMPGFSSPRVPVRMRLMAALVVTAALVPLLAERIVAGLRLDDDATVVLVILRETLVGGAIGLFGRIFFAALETLCTAAAMATGFGNVFGARIDEGETLPELASFIMVAAVTFFFVTGQHAEVVRVLAVSYETLPVGDGIAPRAGLAQLVDMLARAFPLALQITAPFLLYGLIANFSVGLLNRLVPQIPVYFIATPFVIAGALGLLYALGGTIVSIFLGDIQSWLASG